MSPTAGARQTVRRGRASPGGGLLLSLPPLEDFNRLDREAFAQAVTLLFERAPALSARLADARPFAAHAELIARARDIVEGMSESERIAILDAHPRIGEAPVQLSEASRREQGVADAEVDRELLRLQDEYERRFGFRFVVFVAGRPRRAILEVLRARRGNAREEELRHGIAEFLAIAEDRLRKATAGSP